MLAERLDHVRSRYAVSRLLEANGRFAGLVESNESDRPEQPRQPATQKVAELRRYRSFVRGAGIQVLQNGLITFAAFCVSKGGAQAQVLEDVLVWLKLPACPVRGTVVTSEISGRLEIPSCCCPKVVLALVQRRSGELALLEAEAGRILSWLKRLAEGLWIAVGQPDQGEEEDPDAE